MRLLSGVLVNDHRASIRRQGRSLIIEHSDPDEEESDWSRVPLEGIDSVLLVGGASITVDAMAECAARGIRVAALRRSGKIRWSVGGPCSGNVHLRVAQHEISRSEASRRPLCNNIVAGKLRNSLTVCERWRRDADAEVQPLMERRESKIRACLQRAPSCDSEDALRGVEGDAARAHFKVMALALRDCKLGFGGRNRRPPRNEVNAALSFGYGLMLTECSGALEGIGLDPQIGFLHRPRSGRASLGLDLVEEFRPVVDRFVVSAARRSVLRAEHFEHVAGGAVYLNRLGREVFFRSWEASKDKEYNHPLLQTRVERWALPATQATLLARTVRGDLAAYCPFVLEH